MTPTRFILGPITVSGSLPQRHFQGNETNVRMTDSETVLTDIVLFCIY